MMQFLTYIVSFRAYTFQLPFIFFLMTAPLFFCNAQLQDTLKEVVEKGYIERMDNYLAIKASMSNATEAFNVITPNGPGIELYPNTATYAHIGFNYRFISGGFKIAPNFYLVMEMKNQKEKQKNLPWEWS